GKATAPFGNEVRFCHQYHSGASHTDIHDFSRHKNIDKQTGRAHCHNTPFRHPSPYQSYRTASFASAAFVLASIAYHGHREPRTTERRNRTFPFLTRDYPRLPLENSEQKCGYHLQSIHALQRLAQSLFGYDHVNKSTG